MIRLALLGTTRHGGAGESPAHRAEILTAELRADAQFTAEVKDDGFPFQIAIAGTFAVAFCRQVVKGADGCRFHRFQLASAEVPPMTKAK